MPSVYCNVADENYPYWYCPSLPAAKAFTILFGLTTVAHFVQAIIYRKRFSWVIIMAGLWETISFAFRWLSIYDISPEGFASPSQLLVMLAPLWINAFCYMVLGRVVLYFTPEQKVWNVSARRLSLIFVLLDILAFLIQGAGAIAAQAGGNDNPHLMQLGLHIYQGGIGVQEFFICIFLAIAIRTHVEISRHHNHYREQNWRLALFPLYAVLVLITIRVIYRLTEYTNGFDSGIVREEKYFYILEAAPMLFCFVLFNAIHPGLALVGPDSEFPKKEKKTKEKKSKKSKSKDIDLEKQPLSAHPDQESSSSSLS